MRVQKVPRGYWRFKPAVPAQSSTVQHPRVPRAPSVVCRAAATGRLAPVVQTARRQWRGTRAAEAHHLYGEHVDKSGDMRGSDTFGG